MTKCTVHSIHLRHQTRPPSTLVGWTTGKIKGQSHTVIFKDFNILYIFFPSVKDILRNVSVLFFLVCPYSKSQSLTLILSFSQWYGESATTPSTTAACPSGSSRTIDAHYANRTGWYRGSASEDWSFVPTFPPSTLALLHLGRQDNYQSICSH